MKRTLSKAIIAYLTTIVITLLMSSYPVYMGVKVVVALIMYGQVEVSDYPKYIIPYTPICIAVILAIAFLPLASKFMKKLALLMLSALGTGIFLISEILFEKVTVFDGSKAGDLGSWQAYLCVATPEVLNTIEYKTTIGEELTARYSPAFKIHFYLIAILIVLAVVAIAHGFYEMFQTARFDKLRPLILQTMSTAVFVGLCVFACFTAFYRTGNINISALSAWLMGGFFILFGMTAGSYAGGLLFGQRPILSRWIPAMIAALTTVTMYIGELVLMGGVLFTFGEGFWFEPLGFLPLAPMDLIVIVLSFTVTYLLLWLIRKRENGR